MMQTDVDHTRPSLLLPMSLIRTQVSGYILLKEACQSFNNHRLKLLNIVFHGCKATPKSQLFQQLPRIELVMCIEQDFSHFPNQLFD